MKNSDLKFAAQGEKARIIGVHTFRAYDSSNWEAERIEEEICELLAMPSETSEIRELRAKYALTGIFDYKAAADEMFANIRRMRNEAYRELVGMMERFCVRESVVHNLIVTAGRSVVAQKLADINTYSGNIDYGLLGDGTATPSNSDTVLDNEVFRKVYASSSVAANVAFIDFFYSKADTNGTYEEFGTVIDGTGTVDTGQLFTRALTGGWTKSASESMTVSCQYDVN